MRVVRKNAKSTYLWTRCGPNCCTLEHIKKRILQFVSIWKRMWEMNFIRCGDISRFHFAILKVLTLREFLVFRQLWLYTNPERNCSDRKTNEERLTLSPRLQLFVTFCSVEPLYCALWLPSEISPSILRCLIAFYIWARCAIFRGFQSTFFRCWSTLYISPSPLPITVYRTYNM